MSLSDRMNRRVSAAASIGATSISFNSPPRPLMAGEYVTFANHTTEYLVSAPTSTSFTVTPALTANIVDDEVITRFDKYAISDREDIIDYVGLENSADEGLLTFLYKTSIRARGMIEEFVGAVVPQSKTLTTVVTDALRTEYLSDFGNGTKFRLPYLNVTSITSVTLNGTLLSSDDYTLLDGGIILFDYSLILDSKIIIVYNVGFSTVPEDIKEKNLQVCKILFDQSRQGKDLLTVSSHTGVANAELNQSFRDPDFLREFILDGLYCYRQVLI